MAAVFDGKSGDMSLYLNGELAGERSIDTGAAIAPAEKEKLLIGKNALAECAKLTAERATLNRRHLAAGTAGAAAPQGAGCGAVTGRAAG